MAYGIEGAGFPLGYLDIMAVAIQDILLADATVNAWVGGRVNRLELIGAVNEVAKPNISVAPTTIFDAIEPGKTSLDMTIGILLSWELNLRPLTPEQPGIGGVLAHIKKVLTSTDTGAFYLKVPRYSDQRLVDTHTGFDGEDQSNPDQEGSPYEANLVIRSSYTGDTRAWADIPPLLLP